MSPHRRVACLGSPLTKINTFWCSLTSFLLLRIYVPATIAPVPIMFTSTAPMLPHMRSGKLRGLATTGASRSSATPDIPTIAELGFPGYEASLWYGILAAAGTPPAIINVLNTQFVNALKAPDVRDRFTGLGIDVVGGTPDALDKHLRSELAKWEKVIKTAKIRTE